MEQATQDAGTTGETAVEPDDDAVAPEVQAQVDAAAARVEALVAADPELVHGDVVEQVALELPIEVAVALCSQAMGGFVPDTVRQRVFEAEHAEVIARGAQASAERDAAEAKAAQRSARAAATRAATLAREAAEAKAQVQSRTCPNCFQLRSASGVCGCD